MFSLLKLRNPVMKSATYLYGDVLKSYYSQKLSAQEKNALYRSVCIIQKDPACYGLAIFKEVFKRCPDYTKIFLKYGQSADEILKSKDFANNFICNTFMRGVFEYVSKLDDPCEADKLLKELGKKHIKICVGEEHFKNAGKVMMESFKYNLADKWNSEVEQAWKKTTKMMVDGLSKGSQAKEKDC